VTGEGFVVALAGLAHELGYEVSVEQVRSRLPRPEPARGRTLAGPAETRGAVFVAEDPTGRLLGWIEVFRRSILVDESAELGGLVVTASERRRGVGAALLAAAESWASGHGLSRVRVRSNVVRDGVAAFYEARGFTREKTQNVFLKRLADDARAAPPPRPAR
jgi:GNAT superfamily N-acetyltransferase